MKQLTIGAVASESGVNLETIRYYERQGLLLSPPRTSSGYRMFSREAIRRVRFIKRAQDLGFSLKEIKEILALRMDTNRSCTDIRDRVEAKIANVKSKLAALKQLERALVQITAACGSGGPVSDCPILWYLDFENNSESETREEQTAAQRE